jgi:hypothetical protein
MNKSIIILALLFAGAVNAQEVKEPEYTGEVFLIADTGFVKLDKHLAGTRTVAPTGLLLTGVGKVRTQLQVPGCCSTVFVNGEFNLIVKNNDNSIDPMSIIQVFKLEPKVNWRRAELSSVSALGGYKDNNLSYVPFNAKKYGVSSYLVSLSNLEPGEYGVIVLNPNVLNERQRVVATFGVN